MRVALVTPAMASGEQGGAEAFYAGLLAALREEGQEVEQVSVLVDESSFDAVLQSYCRCYELDLSNYDLVISTKAPTYMLRHRNHVSYLLHTLRVFYDMFEHEYGAGSAEQHRQRDLIHRLDQLGLHPHRVRAHFTNGLETYLRLQSQHAAWKDIAFEALHHPPLLRGYRDPQPGEFVFLPGRLHRWKRPHLVIEAFRYIKSDVHLKIAGTGEDAEVLRRLASGDSRIEFLGAVDTETLLDLYSRSLVVPFVPRNEDYGLVTIEAFSSAKPVITCHDSGEPARFVRDFETGFVVAPEPQAIARRIDQLVSQPQLAANMGLRARAEVQQITWHRIVERLLALGSSGSRASNAPIGGTAGIARSPSPRPRVAILDMQPIEPPTGGGRQRLLGLYHDLGLEATYTGTFDWPGPERREVRHSPRLEEQTVPLSAAHFKAAAELAARLGANAIDVSLPRLGRLSPDFVDASGDNAAAADIVIFSHPWLYPVVAERLNRQRQLIVYDSHNVEGYLRTVLLDDGAEGTELAREAAALERDLCRSADLILACSQEDRQLFNRLYGVPFVKIAVVPNGAFTRRLKPATSEQKQQAKARQGLPPGPVAVFIASAYEPNREAAALIVNDLAPTFPEVTFLICGGVCDLLDRSRLPSNLSLKGLVDEETKQDCLWAADLALNPMLSGSGTNVKMFDFLAAGLPVITTPIGARGIETAEEQPFICCDATGFVSAIRRLLADDDLRERLAAAGRSLADSFYSWERVSPSLGTLLQRHRRPRKPFFSVIVPSFERAGQLNTLLLRLSDQTEREFEVIVVDQSREAWTGRADLADLDLLYVHTDVVGAVAARNSGSFYARGEVLAFVDDDCLPDREWLSNARPYFEDTSVVGIEGLITSDCLDDPDYRVVTNEGFEGIGFMTANLLLRRETFLRAGGFDLRFDHPHFREDTDLAWRCLAYGSIPFGHDVRVHHPAHRRDQQRESLAERNRFFEKDPLLLAKHPARYRALFLREQHYRNTEGFWDHFFRGAQKYGVELPAWVAEAEATMHEHSRQEVVTP